MRSERLFAVMEKRKHVSASSLTPRKEDGGYYYYQSEWSVVILVPMMTRCAFGVTGGRVGCFSTLDTAQVREGGRPQHSDFLLTWACLVVTLRAAAVDRVGTESWMEIAWPAAVWGFLSRVYCLVCLSSEVIIFSEPIVRHWNTSKLMREYWRRSVEYTNPMWPFVSMCTCEHTFTTQCLSVIIVEACVVRVRSVIYSIVMIQVLQALKIKVRSECGMDWQRPEVQFYK